jgi:hypothetical protein
VTPEEPQDVAARLRIPSKAKLIGGKQIRFGLVSGGHKRKFLEEAGSSFAIPHEEEYFENFSSSDLITACGDLALKNFVASRCLALRLEREDKEAKKSSAAVSASLQNRVTELEKQLAAEQKQGQHLLREKEDEAKMSQAALDTLRLEMENLASARADLSVQLCNKDTEPAEAKNETS